MRLVHRDGRFVLLVRGERARWAPDRDEDITTGLRGCRHGGCPITSIKVANAAGMTDRFTVLLLVRLGRPLGRQVRVQSLRAHREGTYQRLDRRGVDMCLPAMTTAGRRAPGAAVTRPGATDPGSRDIEVPICGQLPLIPGGQPYPCTPKPLLNAMRRDGFGHFSALRRCTKANPGPTYIGVTAVASVC